MPNRRSRYPAVACAAVVLAMACLARPAAAQNAATFSPTYAASEGSPYRDVYARTFGAGGPPAEGTPPLVTGASPPAPAADSAGDVVYVIEDGRLLTYRAEDYARGGPALSGAALPAAAGDAAARPRAELSSITNRLYGAPPPQTTGAGPAAPSRPGSPIQLVPPAH